MNDKKLLIAFIIGTLVVLGGSVVVLNSTSLKPTINISQNAKVEVLEKNFDWGEVSYDGPKATKTFKIKNSGTETLKLTKIKTSCTCTTAQIIVDNQKSPLFSMHGASNWVGEVTPGKEADLLVTFDQQFHGPSGVGQIERVISLETNDLKNPKLEFNLKGNVIKK